MVCAFSFFGGSSRIAAAEWTTAAVQRATAERLLLASPNSGGTRIQEGTVAFLQIVENTAAIRLHKRSGLPYLGVFT